MAMVAGFVHALACELKMVQCLQSWAAAAASSSQFKLNSAAGFVSIKAVAAASSSHVKLNSADGFVSIQAAASSSSSSSSHFKLNPAAGFVSIPVVVASGGMTMGRGFSGCSVLRPWQKFDLQGAACSSSQPRHYSQHWHAGAARRKEIRAASIEGETMRRSGEDRSSRGLLGENSNEAVSLDEDVQNADRKMPQGPKVVKEVEVEEEEETGVEDKENDDVENDLLDELEGAEEAEEIKDGIEDIDDDLWEDEESEEQPVTGDGGDGGGFVLGGASWGDKALKIAEEVLVTFGGNLVIYAFKVRKEAGEVLVRLDKLSNKYGSPTVEDIDEFSSAYGARLEEAGQMGLVPDNLALEVSSPGAERFLRVPQDLSRFRELPMYVRYTEANSSAKDGVFELDSIDLEAGNCTWKVANVRINRDSAGKGRGLTRKQRLWRLDLPFTSLIDVRLYVDV